MNHSSIFKKEERRKGEAQQQRGASAGKRGAVLKKVGPSVAKEFQQTESADEEDDYRKPRKTTKRPRLDKRKAEEDRDGNRFSKLATK